MRDYWLSKLMFDLQQPAIAAEFKANRESVFEKYHLEEPVKQALRASDIPFLAARTNPYLLRYYFFTTGMKDAEFIRKLRDG